MARTEIDHLFHCYDKFLHIYWAQGVRIYSLHHIPEVFSLEAMKILNRKSVVQKDREGLCNLIDNKIVRVIIYLPRSQHPSLRAYSERCLR